MGDARRSGRGTVATAITLLLLACSSTDDETDTDEPSATEDTDDTDDTDTTGEEPLDTDDTTVVASLSGLRWELPCIAQTSPALCTTLDGLADETTLAGGATNYDVTLRIRGIIEPKTYDGGTAGDGWNRDGTPANDTANIYALAISDPQAIYYVNSGTTRLASELYAEAIDFEMTVSMSGGVTVALQADSVDALQIRNIDANGDPIVIPDVPPAPDPYDGQFVQMDVVSVLSR